MIDAKYCLAARYNPWLGKSMEDLTPRSDPFVVSSEELSDFLEGLLHGFLRAIRVWLPSECSCNFFKDVYCWKSCSWYGRIGRCEWGFDYHCKMHSDAAERM